MAGKRTVESLYREYVVDHGLERAGLFEAILARDPSLTTVLYPGCFLHVTPSFFFPHVVYVDRSDLAASFFSDAGGVAALVDNHRRYRRKSYRRFIHHDFTEPLPLPDGSFDLLLSLYAGGVTKACARYLRAGGLLVSNDHAGDADEARHDETLEFVATGHARRNRVVFDDAARGVYYLFRKRR